MRRLSIVLFFVVAVAAAYGWFALRQPPSPMDISEPVRIHQGIVVGGINRENPAIREFNGIPYATAEAKRAERDANAAEKAQLERATVIADAAADSLLAEEEQEKLAAAQPSGKKKKKSKKDTPARWTTDRGVPSCSSIGATAERARGWNRGRRGRAR